MSPRTNLLHGCLQAVDMEKAMGAIEGQRRFTRMVQLAVIIFAVVLPGWTVVLVLLLMEVDLIRPLFPPLMSVIRRLSISPAAGHGFFAVPHSN